MEPQNKNDISSSEEKGLSDEEVAQRKEKGESNDLSLRMSKSNGRILVENFFPFFNVVLYGVAILFFIFEMVLSKQHRGGADQDLFRYLQIRIPHPSSSQFPDRFDPGNPCPQCSL